MTSLSASAFGVLQLGIGYVDVYPLALAMTALYLWTALRTIQAGGHPVWPLLLVAVGPFWYIGLALLAPSALVVVAVAARTSGPRRVVGAATVALLAAGMATLPGLGRPFAWATFAGLVRSESWSDYGLSTASNVLPLDYLMSPLHAAEVLSTLGLTDPVGMTLLVVVGGWWLVRRPVRVVADPAALLLAALTLSYLAYVVAMDPLLGAFSDWDLFSYGAAATSLGGAYAFIAWGRRCPRFFGALLGLALATASVHLLARLNAIDVEVERHRVESPHHVLRPLPLP